MDRKVKIVVQFSGGKDSQACLIKACNDYGSENITAVFCDTGWEHEETYDHVHKIAEMLGVNLVILRNSKVDGMVGLCTRMLREESQPSLFGNDEPELSCMSLYHGLCE